MTMPVHLLAVLFFLSSAFNSHSALTRDRPPGLDAVVASQDVVLFGETYGTVENPQIVEDAALLALEGGRGVTIALEIPQEEDAVLHAYLNFQSSDFVDGPFWHSDFKDGRNSEAMKHLLTKVHEWRSLGYRIDLVTLDPVKTPRSGEAFQSTSLGITRDEAMANRVIAAMQKAPGNLLLVQTGNIHQKLSRGVAGDPEFRPMGFFVANYAHRFAPGVRIASLDSHYYAGGEAWVCQGPAPSNCGVVTLSEKWDQPLSGETAPRGVTLLPDTENGASSGWVYFTERVHASDPAVR